MNIKTFNALEPKYQNQKPKNTGFPEGTRFLHVRLVDEYGGTKGEPKKLSLNDLRTFYRVIRKCKLADISEEDEERMANEDFEYPILHYYFVVRDSLFLMHAIDDFPILIGPYLRYSISYVPFKEQLASQKKKEEEK